MLENKQIINQYFEALDNQYYGSYSAMEKFKSEHPSEYKMISCMYQKRKKIRRDIDVMTSLSDNAVYFGTLTFDSVNDSKSERTKRKQVWRHLGEILSLFLIVEEYGEDNGRYHIHFVGCFQKDKCFDDFFEWGGREQIERVRSKKKVARYLCDYIVKQVPRIRRNKALIECSREYQKAKTCEKYKVLESFADKHYGIMDMFYLDASGELPF